MYKLIGKSISFKEYFIFNIKYRLKSEVSNKHLGWVWWVLDPLFQMLIYSFVFGIVYKSKEPNFPVFLFAVLLPWKWTSSSIMGSIDCIRGKKGILSSIYIPKILFPLEVIILNFVKMLYSEVVLLAIMLFFGILPTWHTIEVISVTIVNFLFILGISLIISHLGLFISDFKNLFSHINKLWWYVSPGIYSIESLPEAWRTLIYLNPLTTLFISYRNTLLYGKSPLYKELFILSVISIILIIIGLNIHAKYDKKYSKLI